MSKIAAELANKIPWLSDLSTINTIIFFILLVIIIIGVLRIKKEDIDKFKNIPLNDGEEENSKTN